MQKVDGVRYYSIGDIDRIERENNEERNRRIEIENCRENISDSITSVQTALGNILELRDNDCILASLMETPIRQAESIRDNMNRLLELLGINKEEKERNDKDE